MRCGQAVSVLPILALALACSSSGGPTDDDGNPPPPANTISVRNMPEGFTPATLTISAGDSVRFVWAASSTLHNVYPDQGNAASMPRSPNFPLLLDNPQDFWVAFPTAGVFGFYCSAHGANPSAGTLSGMAGTVTVQ